MNWNSFKSGYFAALAGVAAIGHVHAIWTHDVEVIIIASFALVIFSVMAARYGFDSRRGK